MVRPQTEFNTALPLQFLNQLVYQLGIGAPTQK
jgi:hypothetical protein